MVIAIAARSNDAVASLARCGRSDPGSWSARPFVEPRTRIVAARAE
ncbi:hypothetical protein LC55x_2821 [Lysobacter capsici]|nr:hypothetical protein LC55x_2821 [Lysobacter capsici]